MSALSLEDAFAYLKITENGTGVEMQATIDAAEAAIARRVGPLDATETTQRVRACGGTLALTVLPAISLTSVTPVGGSALTLSDLYLDTDSGVVTGVASGWHTVVYRAGRATLPDDLMLAVKELVRHLWGTQRGSGNARPRPQGELSNTLPGSAYTFPIRVEQLLAPYAPFGFA